MALWAFIMFIFFINDGIKQTNGHPVCDSKECIKFAEMIRKNMNPSVNPCEDFYGYACGKWTTNGTDVTTIREIVQKEIEDQVKAIILSGPEPNDIRPVRLLKQWYKTCLDVDAIYVLGMQPLISVLSKLGGAPLFMQPSEWNETTHPWQEVDDYYGALTGQNVFHDLRVAMYGTNATDESVVIDSPDIPPYIWEYGVDVFDEIGENSEDGQIVVNRTGGYFNYAMKFAMEIAAAGGFDVPRERLEKDVENMLYFQFKLHKITFLMDDYTVMTLSDFHKWYDGLNHTTSKSQVNWAEKVKKMFRIAGMELEKNVNVFITSPKYFEALVQLLDTTPPKTIGLFTRVFERCRDRKHCFNKLILNYMNFSVNYMHWYFISSNEATTKELQTLRDKLTSFLAETSAARSERCLREFKFTDIIGYAYIRKHYSDRITDEVSNLIENSRSMIAKQIEESQWLDETTRTNAQAKLRNIRKFIGYPSWYNNATLMNNQFERLRFGPTYFENKLAFHKFDKLENLRDLRRNKITTPWLLDPTAINTYYMPTDNAIYVPAGNLREPFYSGAQPDAVNYGMTGFLMSHELSHAFDESRHMFDKEGNTLQWSAPMEETYKKKARCFVDQLMNYTIEGLIEESQETYRERNKDENIADIMGLQAAFKGFKWKAEHSGTGQLKLPTLEQYTSEQLFFLSFANLWCETIRPEDRLLWSKLKTHSIGRLRLIGSVSNSDDFTKSFNCQADTPMNPRVKCNIWK